MDMHHQNPPASSPDRGRRKAPVSVNGCIIPEREIAAEVQNFPARDPDESWFAATRALVIRTLLVQEAARLEIVPCPQTDEKDRLETAEDASVRQLIAQAVVVPTADDATLRRFYDQNQSRFTSPPLYEVDHILIAARARDPVDFAAARATATALAAILAADPDRFAELARAHSACPSAALGGSLGQIGPGDTTPDFEAALQALTEGEISVPVETRYGVHLIRLGRRIDGAVLPFDAVRTAIAAYLSDHVYRQATAQYLARLVGHADIEGIVLGALTGASSPLLQ